MMPSRVILVGVGGFGAIHLINLRRLKAINYLEIVTLVDPFIKARALADPTFTPPDDAPLYDTLSEALSATVEVDIVVICVAIHLHLPITKLALQSGSDVLLEKPPFARMIDFEAILALEQETGQVVQVGFQSLGSGALEVLGAEGDLDLGKVRSVRAIGTWLRKKSYWTRTPWISRRSIGDEDVMGGVSTNALAHAVITALHIGGMKEVEDVGAVEVELYRANPVDVDDTASIRITPSRPGPKVIIALTLCASVQTAPTINIVGERGSAIFDYVADTVESGGNVRKYDRINLLQDLIEHRRVGDRLICPLRTTGAFMRVMEAIRLSPEPTHIQRKYIDVRGEGDEAHVVIQDVEGWMRKALEADALFSEVRVPWAFQGRDKIIAKGSVDGKTILEIQDGGSIISTSSTRPYIHPIRTLSGIELTATHPADHDWHCGLGFAVPDVDGCSFWGGGTYIHGKGYIDLDNHGHMTTERMDYITSTSNILTDPIGLDQTILWHNHTHQTPIRELRSLRWSTLPTSVTTPGWTLSFRSTLTTINGPLSLGSPGTNGRKNGGYGGFFWRLPRCSDVNIMSSGGLEGEDDIHGVTSPWISWSADFDARPGATGRATIVIVPDGEESEGDPWVVRNEAYPGIGSALAWENRFTIGNGESISRAFKVAVMDGRLDREQVEKVVDILQKMVNAES